MIILIVMIMTTVKQYNGRESQGCAVIDRNGHIVIYNHNNSTAYNEKPHNLTIRRV